MSTLFNELLGAFEVHSVDQIRRILDSGFDVHTPVRGKTPITHLVEMYLRSDRFADCLRLMLDRGAILDDPLLQPILLNDVKELDAAIRSRPDLLKHRTSMACTFTPRARASPRSVA